MRWTAKMQALVHAWPLLDFFGDARRSGGTSSTLTTTIFSQSFLSLVIAALLYPEPPLVPFAAANLCLSTLLVALGALEVEETAGRRLADRVLLGTAPVPRLQVVLARATHGAFHIVLLTTGMALPPAILLACRERAFWLGPAYLVAACACAGLAAGILATALRALRRWLGLARSALLAGTAKALLLGSGVALFALGMPALRKDADALPFGRLGAELLPPYHAAKLLAEPAGEAWRLLPWLGLAALLVLLSAWLGERERERSDRVGHGGALAWIERAAAGPGPVRGLCAYTAALLWRSPGLRARALPLLGVPAAVAFLGLRGGDERGRFLFAAIALQFPAIYLPFVISLLPRADHAGAGWVFASVPPVAVGAIRRAVWVALCTRMLLPVHAVLLVILLASGIGPAVAVPTAAFAFGTGVLAARAMVRAVDTIPFTRDADADGGIEFGDLVAAGILLAVLGAGFAMVEPGLRHAMAAASMLLSIWMLRPPR